MTMDYRLSHISPNKGVTYDVSFEALPYRKMVWMWEKKILTNQITKIRLKHGNLRYLDFACGTGRILAHLEASMVESYGVDVSQPMLDIAEQRVPFGKSNFRLSEN
jgi:ubiquinone/menaquinone biosynthesis C-methylase UbiE